jgi:hypothetical protein
MKLGTESVIRFVQLLTLILLLVLVPRLASAQTKSTPPPPPPPPPKTASVPAPHPTPAAIAPRTGGSAPAAHPSGTGSTSGTHPGGNASTTGANLTNSRTGTANNRISTATNKTASTTGSNKATIGTTRTNRTTNATTATDPRAPTGLNLRPTSTLGGGTGATRTNTSTAVATRTGAADTANASNPPGTTKLANGGTRMLHANGSSVERNRSGKVTGVTTAKGATAKMDAYGRATSIHDGMGTTISRGPHGERRIETTRADHSRLVSNGSRGGYSERTFSRGGREYAVRSYYYNGHYYSRVYAPYSYGGHAYYGFVPAFYYEPLFYGWVYNAWPAPVPYAWGWYGAPWYAPYGYYFVPYAVYPAPAFWLADFALAESLQVGADEATSGSLRNESGLMYVSARVSQRNQGNGSPLVTSAIKDELAEQVKQVIADEKDAAAKRGDAAAGSVTTPAVPPSIDPRFALFIVSSELSLDTEVAACSITAGDIIRRKDYIPDGNSSVAVEVVSSKEGDCFAGTPSRLEVDDLEEMHDALREKVDDGLKLLSEHQGKGGIPSGPAATLHAVPEGHADPDLMVESDLKKQQEAADATEKEILDASSDSGSAG